MYAALKLWFVPVWTVILATSTAHSFAQYINLVAIVTIIAGVLVVARYRGALEASDKAGAAAMRERDAERDRSERLQEKLVDIQAKLTELEARPNLDQHAELLSSQSDLLRNTSRLVAGQSHLVEQVAAAVSAHDENAAKLAARQEMLLTNIVEKLHVIGRVHGGDET